MSTLLYGDLRTGRITGAIDATSASWAQELNDSGSVSSVTVPEAVVRRLGLRNGAAAARTFLAFEEDGRIREAGPIWSRTWDWEKGRLTLGAAGLWSLFDHRKVLPVIGSTRVQDLTTVVANTDLGGIARALVAQAMTHVGGDLPLVLPASPVGTRTETFPGWKLLWVGDQLRELTKRDSTAPDIRFTPRRKTDPRFLEWVMEVGTEAAPLLSQAGADWVFDTTAPLSPVVGISTDEDATAMAFRGWVTGNGTEETTLISGVYLGAFVNLGWPLLETDESRSTVEVQDTLDGHAINLTLRSSRPVEVWKMAVRSDAAREVRAGDYVQVVTRGDAWLPDGTRRMRVASMSGSLGDDTVQLVMYAMAGVL